VLVISANYRIPSPSLPSRWMRALARDWTISAVLTYSSGALIQVPAAQNNLSSLLFQSTLSNRVPGQPLFLVNPNGPLSPTTQFILNPKAWSDPAPGQWGFSAPYYSDYRWRRTPTEYASFGRMFRFWEGITLEARVEFFNVFNRLIFPAPTSTNALATQVVTAQGLTSSGFGYLATAGGFATQRNGQLVVRFQF
jgi:hypothetical protein